MAVRPATIGQVLYPASDHTDGAWTPSTGSDHYAVLDDTTDADYVSTTSNSAFRVNMQNGSTPGSGTRTLSVRAFGSPEKKLIVRLIEGSTTVQTFTHDPVQTAIGVYDEVVTNSITNYADLDVECEIADATSPPTLAVTWGAIGTAASGTTSCTPSYPTGISAATSKLFLLVTGRSNTADTAATITGGGWTSVGSVEGGTGTWGVDTGTRRVELWQKDTVTGSESGSITVNLSGTTANTLRASIFRVEVPALYGISVSVGTGSDTSNDTSYSATSGTSLAFQANDLLVLGTAQNIDTGTASSSAVSASGITFGTLTNRADTAVTNGNDHRHILNTVPVSSGSGTVAPTFSYTISASGSGPTLFARMRAVVPTEKGRVTSIRFTIPEGSGGSGVVLAGAGSGAAAASGALTIEMPVTGAALGVASGAGALAVSMPLDGITAVAVVTAAGDAQIYWQIEGQAIAQALAAAAMSVGQALAGAGAAQADGSAAATIEQAIAGAAAGQAAGGGDLTTGVPPVPLSGAAVAQALAAGDMYMLVGLVGPANAAALAGGDVTLSINLAGAAAGQAGAAGELTLAGQVPLAGAAAGEAAGAGVLTITMPLSAAAAAQAIGEGNLTMIVSIAGAAAGQAAASGAADVLKLLAGAAAAQADAAGAVLVSMAFGGQALGEVLAAGDLRMVMPLAGAAAAQTGAVADLNWLNALAPDPRYLCRPARRDYAVRPARRDYTARAA